MDKSLFRSLGGGVKLLLDVLITFVVFTISLILLLLLGQAIYGVPVKDFISSALYIDNPGALKYLVAVQSISLFFFPSLAIAWLFSRPREFFQLRHRVELKAYVVIIIAMIVAQGIVNILGYWNYNIHLSGSLHAFEIHLRQMEHQAQLITNRILSGTSYSQLLVNIVVVALIPAIGEEMFFRGVLQRHLTQAFRNVHVAIITTAFIFAFAHFEFFTFLPRLLLGLILGYIVYWLKNIWSSIIAHFTNNFLGVMIYFISLRQGKTLEDLSQVQNPGLWLPILSLIILVPIFYILKKWADDKS